jgi:ABC-type polysaccharide/polyol phosphate transport system ATPase subunit
VILGQPATMNEAAPVTEQRSPTISIRNLGKAYNLYDRPFDFMKELLTGRTYHRTKQVLSDVSIDIHEKEIVGIIGRNGAGKSTLLKIIAGTLSATSGSAEVRGRVSAILELGTGFNPAFTGRENVILSALMRGMSEEQVRAKLDSIIAFSGLEDVIDEPFHTYSSGMQGRLAFAAAVSVEADVIIIDEALSTGDARFAARSLRRIHEICQSGVTALFVSHTTYQVMQLCSRAIWIDGGKVRMDGPPIEVVRAYEYEMHEAIARDQGRMVGPAEVAKIVPVQAADVSSDSPSDSGELISTAPGSDTAQPDAPPSSALAEDRQETVAEPVAESAPAESTAVAAEDAAAAPEAKANIDTKPIETLSRQREFSTGQYKILDIAFLDRSGNDTRAFRLGETLKLRVSYECLLAKLPEYSCGLAVAFNRTSDFEAVMYFNTNYAHSDEELAGYLDVSFRKFVGSKGVVEATIDPIQLRAGEYFVSLGILPNQPGMHEFYEYHHCAFRVRILPNGFDEPSVFYPMVSWTNKAL